MSNASIFAIGVFVTLLLGGGLAFTIYEMRRIYQESVDRAPLPMAPTKRKAAADGSEG